MSFPPFARYMVSSDWMVLFVLICIPFAYVIDNDNDNEKVFIAK